MRKRHSSAFKAKIVTQALKEEKTLTQIAAENEIHPNQISAWKATALNGMPTLFEGENKASHDQAAHQQQLEELYAQIGRLTTGHLPTSPPATTHQPPLYTLRSKGYNQQVQSGCGEGVSNLSRQRDSLIIDRKRVYICSP